MKTRLIIFLLFILETITIMASGSTEKQQYSVVHSKKEIEIRYYPSATLATVYSSARSYKELSGSGFRKLAGYIFGGNESGTKISMTSPVHMDINDSRSSMSFVMPSAYHMGNLPKSDNPEVIFEETKDEYVAVLKFGGYASDRAIKSYSEKLRMLLNEKGITHYGNFRFLGYNPPYQFFGRTNEIIVSVNWPEQSGH